MTKEQVVMIKTINANLNKNKNQY